MDQLTKITSGQTESSVNMQQVLLRERLTNLLAKISNYSKDSTENPLSTEGIEYAKLRYEIEDILTQHPEWRDVASQWLPK